MSVHLLLVKDPVMNVKTQCTRKTLYRVGLVLCGLLICSAVPAQEPTPFDNRSDDVDEVIDRTPERDAGDAAPESALDYVQDAAEVVQEMQNDSDLRWLLEKSHGIFVIPDYGAAALVIGAAGGEGVLIPRENGRWGNPGLYRVGSLSAGLQVGVVAGTIAFVLLNEASLESFKAARRVSFSADAGLVIADWSNRAREPIDRSVDLVVWTDTEGLLAELSLGIDTVTWNNEDNADYYGIDVEPAEVFSGRVDNPNSRLLQQALNR